MKKTPPRAQLSRCVKGTRTAPAYTTGGTDTLKVAFKKFTKDKENREKADFPEEARKLAVELGVEGFTRRHFTLILWYRRAPSSTCAVSKVAWKTAVPPRKCSSTL